MRILALALVLLCIACPATAFAQEYEPFGEFSAMDINSDGGLISDDLFGDATYTIMHFFSSWDDACMAELQSLQIVNTQGNGEFQIVCVMIDSVDAQLAPNLDAIEQVQIAAEDMLLTYPILSLFDDTLLHYGSQITEVPTNIVVYHDGDIIDSFTGAMDFNEWVDYCIWLTEE